ncbi:MAG: hypothetical protein RI947_649 [Candidatus Parcubacteria bacterium]|jgi:glycosyltransferase involved in cell wall biosynthesis
MISIIIPYYNEEDNLLELYGELHKELEHRNQDYEILFVDDGSIDNGYEVLKSKVLRDKHVVLLRNRKRFGKGYSLARGVHKAQGEVAIFMDADLQNDPKDIQKFLKKIQEGYDLVNGIRDSRDDNIFIKSYSKLGNYFVKVLLNSPFTDVNSGFKAIRKEVLNEIALYANNFRFLPLAAYYKGFKVGQVTIHNRPRLYGKSKFGTFKVFYGLFDTLNAYFLYQFSEQPLHFFGSIGGFFFLIGFAMSLYMSFERIFFNVLLYRRPALLFAILLMIIGIQIVMTGFIGELIVYLNKKKS